jgi:hypothetical protein
MTRSFTVSAYMGENNSEKVIVKIDKFGPHEAAKEFAEKHNSDFYSIREEHPESNEKGLFTVWSAGWSGSGQRIWIREYIGN